MSQFELVFETVEMTPEIEDAVYDRCDALIATHGSLSRLTVTAEGLNVLDGAHRIVAILETLGVQVKRLCEDFVTRRDIADRSAVTPQAVGLWVRGERLTQQAQPFPAVYAPVSGGIWLWSEVEPWLSQCVQGYESDGLAHPARADFATVNGWLDNRYMPTVNLLETLVAGQLSMESRVHGPIRTPWTAVPGRANGRPWAKAATVTRLDVTLAA